MKAFKILFVFLIAICITNCSEKEEKCEEIGEYVYIDRYNCVHINRKCLHLITSGGEEGEEPRYMVHRIEVKKLREIGQTCSFCVSDESYKELERLIKQ